MRGQSRRARTLRFVPVLVLLAALATLVGSGSDRTATASSPGPKELRDLWTPTSRTVENADGSRTASLYGTRVNYRDSARQWQEIDSQLVPADTPGYAVRSKANSFRALFKDSLDDGYLRFDVDGQPFTFAAVGAARAAGKSAGRSVSYGGAFDGVDLRYDSLNSGVEETLTLADARAPVHYRFVLTPPAPVALNPIRQRDGSWALREVGSGRVVFGLAAPSIAEAGGKPGHDHVSLKVTPVGDKLAIDLDLDAQWLHAQGRKFPVSVDPTITVQPTALEGNWEMPCAVEPCTAMGAPHWIGNDGTTYRSTFKFDLGDVPPNANITTASLGLWYDNAACLETTCNKTTHPLELHRVTTPWDTVNTSSSQIGWDSVNVLSTYTISPGGTSRWMSFGLTSAVQNWVRGTWENDGVLLKRSTEACCVGGPTIPGADDTSGHQPKLDVTYTSDGVKLYPPSTVHGNGAELEWTKFDGSTGNTFLRYEVHRSTDPSFTPSASTLIATIGDVNQTSFVDTTAAPNTSFTYKIVVNGNAPSWPQTVTTPAAGTARKVLQPVQAAAKASYVEQDTTAASCANYGASDRIEAGADASYTRHGLLAFDLSDLPTRATIQSASLSLYMDSAPWDGGTVEVHRVSSAWAEGTGTWDCTNDGATWTNAAPGVAWTTPGGDYDPAVVASKTHASTDAAGWDDLAVGSLVQQWTDGTRPNLGFLLRASDETHAKDTTIYYVSDDETVTPSLRPKLTVVYSDGSTSQGPVVSIATPAPKALVSGTAVDVTAAATDDQGVTKVEFLVDGAVVGTDATAPFETFWNSTLTTDGDRVLTARAYDAAGNVSTSAPVTVSVENSAPPTTSVTGVVDTYPAEVRADAPSGYWRLGEASGTTAADASGNAADGTYDAVTLGAAGALANDGNTAVTPQQVNGVPTADNFVNARILTGGGSISSSNVGATKEPNEPDIAYGGGTSSLWYTWTAGATGTVQVETTGSSFDTVLGVYTGNSVGALTEVVSNDDYGKNLTSLVQFSATAGAVYRFGVDGFGGATGNVALKWTQNVAPSNNNFASSQTLSSGAGAAFTGNTYATRETGEPTLCGVSGGRSVWYSWTAPASGTVQIDTIGSSFNTVLGVYTGSSLTALTSVACDNDSGGSYTSKVSFSATAGTVYRIAVDGSAAAYGTLKLSWNQPSYGSVSAGDRFDFANTAAFSAEAWVKPTTIDATARRIVSKESSTGTTRQGWDVTLSTSGLTFERVRDGAADSVTSTAGLPANAWSHVVATYDGSTMALYVNGAQVASGTAKTKALLDTTTAFRIGRNAAQSSDGFAGSLDEAAVYGTALSAARVKAHYDAGQGNATTTVRGTATVNATAADDKAVTKVEFYMDDLRFAVDDTPPYSVQWDTLDANQPAYDGTHVLTTRAYDAGNHVTTSTAQNVTVDNNYNTRYDSSFTTTSLPQDVTYDPTATTQDSYGVNVTVTNSSDRTWSASDVVLRYRWASPDPLASADFQYTDGPDVALPNDLAPGQSATVTVMAKPPTLPDGVNKAQYDLRVDAFSKSTGTYFAAKGNKPVENPVIVNRDLVRGALGLERFYHYVGDDLGAGMQHIVNVANGNSLVRFTPFDAPGRGLNTVVDLTYNSLEKKCECPAGNNWSIAASTLTRFGNPIDVHPNKADEIGGNAKRYIELTDGDGTTLRFTSSDGVHWQEPAGVNLYLRKYSDTDATKKWAFTRPDGVTFFYDADGYPTSVVDANGNAITYALEDTPPGEDPGGPKKRITKITDAGGRSFVVDYYSKAEAKKAHVRGRIQTITDHDGHAFEFLYYEDGNLRKLVQHGGTNADGSFLADRAWVFTYTTSNGNGPALADPQPVDPPDKVGDQSTRLYSVRDPRGGLTTFSYLGSGNGTDRWKLATRTDRAGAVTKFDYDTVNRVTTVTEPLDRASKYAYDTEGKVTTVTNPLGQQTTLDWTADRAVGKVTEPAGGYIQYAYDQNGYLTDQWVLTDKATATTAARISHTQLVYDHVAVDANDTPTGHISRLVKKIQPNGDVAGNNPDDYSWTFTYDANGNLLTLTDPEKGTTRYTYTTRADGSVDGTIATVEDANSVAKGLNLTTKLTSYDANGIANTITDPVGSVTRAKFDDDGLLLWVQDPEHDGSPTGDARYRMSFTYDAFHRLTRQSAPKSTTDDLGDMVWTDAAYDANDNLVAQWKGHYGSNDVLDGVPVTRTTYDAMDQPDTVSTPSPTGTGTADTKYTFDLAGRMTSMTLPKGVASTSIAKDHEVDYGYDKLDRLATQTRFDVDEGTGALNRSLAISYCYDLAGDLRSVTSPRGAASLGSCPAATDPYTPTAASYTTLTEYDAAHRVVKTTSPKRSDTQPALTQTQTYDRDGNVLTSTNAEGTVTSREYDHADRPTKATTPLSPTHDLVSKTFYDAVGNVVKTISPRAWDASPDTGTNKTNFPKYVTSYGYDADNRLVKVTLPVDGTTTDQQAYVHTVYDKDGRVKWTSIPATADTPGGVLDENKNEYTYWDTGWIRSSTSAGNRSATPTFKFDYEATGQQVCRAVIGKGVCATSIAAVTGEATFWTFGKSSLLERITDVGNASDGGGSGQFSTYAYDLNGRMTRADEGRGQVAAGQVTSTVKTTYDTLGQPTEVSAKKADATNWTFTKLTYDDNGNMATREDDGKESDTGAVVTAGRKHVFGYDGADWLVSQLDKGKNETDCSDDQRITTDFTKLGVEQKRIVEAAQSGCTWKTKQTTRWSYFQNGQLDKLRIWNGAITDNSDITQVTPQAGVSLKESHDVSYVDNGVYQNGNRTTDLMKIDGPNTSCKDTSCTAQYTYDARDKLVKEVDGHGGTITYNLDAHGNLQSQDKDGKHTDFHYDGQQLQWAQTGTTKESYWYDDAGRLDCVTIGGAGHADCNHTGTAPASVVEDYAYDYLDRLRTVGKYLTDGTTSHPDRTSSYVYDALSRVETEKEHHWRYPTAASGDPDPTNGALKETDRTTKMSYLGLSQDVSQETVTGGDSTSKDYLYDAYGHRIGMTDTRSSGTKQYTFGDDVHGSTQLLLDDAGQAQASYGYTAYGEADKALTKEKNPDYDPTKTDPKDDASSPTTPADDPLNAYRYAGKRFDSGAGDIDMGARHFGPGERFLQPDQFKDALGDLDLATDPLSGNRYALAGGNPLSFVEVDGHMVMADGGGGASRSPVCTVSSTQQKKDSGGGGGFLDSVGGFFKGVGSGAKDAAVSVYHSPVGQFAKGAGEGAWEMGKGFYDMGRFAQSLDPMYNPTGFVGQWKKTAKVGKFMVTHPSETAGAMWKGVSDPYRHGNGWEKGGRATFDIATILVPVLKASKVGTAGRAMAEVGEAGVKAAGEGTPRAYSVAFETRLSAADMGKSRSVHFNRANAALDRAMSSDSDFAASMEDLIPGVGESVSKAGGRSTPAGWTWHHATTEQGRGAGAMQLVPTEQHSAGSAWWALLHPLQGFGGGYAEWARPAGAP